MAIAPWTLQGQPHETGAKITRHEAGRSRKDVLKGSDQANSLTKKKLIPFQKARSILEDNFLPGSRQLGIKLVELEPDPFLTDQVIDACRYDPGEWECATSYTAYNPPEDPPGV